MERLPDRQEETYEKQDLKHKEKKRSGIDMLKIYGPLLIVGLLLFFIMADEPVPLNQLTVTDIRSAESMDAGTAEGLYVAGTISEEGGRCSKANVSFDAETGAAEVCVREYQITTFFGTKQFVAYIEEDPGNVNEIWLVYDDEAGTVDRELIWSRD